MSRRTLIQLPELPASAKHSEGILTVLGWASFTSLTPANVPNSVLCPLHKSGCKPWQEMKLKILWYAKACCLIMQMVRYIPPFSFISFNFISRPLSYAVKARYKLRPSQAKQKRLRFLTSSLSDGWGSKIKPTALNPGCLNDLQVQHWIAKIALLSSRPRDTTGLWRWAAFSTKDRLCQVFPCIFCMPLEVLF